MNSLSLALSLFLLLSWRGSRSLLFHAVMREHKQLSVNGWALMSFICHTVINNVSKNGLFEGSGSWTNSVADNNVWHPRLPLPLSKWLLVYMPLNMANNKSLSKSHRSPWSIAFFVGSLVYKSACPCAGTSTSPLRKTKQSCTKDYYPLNPHRLNQPI